MNSDIIALSHSVYIQVLAESGLVGTVVTCWRFGSCFFA